MSNKIESVTKSAERMALLMTLETTAFELARTACPFSTIVGAVMEGHHTEAQGYNPEWHLDELGEGIRKLAMRWFELRSDKPTKTDLEYLTLYLESAFEGTCGPALCGEFDE